MAAFSFKIVLEQIKHQRERAVIIVLLVILLAVSWNVYSSLQRQKTDQEGIIKEILEDHNYTDPVVRDDLKDQLDPLQVASRLLTVPPPDDIVRPLIEVDPLRPREDIHEIRKRIGTLMEEGRLLREQGRWADAIITYDAVLELDPASAKYDYRGGTARELRELSVREQTRERMTQARTEADKAYDEGIERLNAADELKARDVLLQARREYLQILAMDPDRGILDAAFYAGIDSRLEELEQTTTELVRKTLEQDIAARRGQAENEIAAYQADPSDPARLAAAREALIEGLSVIDLVDPQRNIVAASEVSEIETRLTQIEEMITAALPDLVGRAQEALVALKNSQTAEEGIAKGEAALTILDLLRRLREEPTFQERYQQVQSVLQDLRRRLDLQRAQQIYAEAEARYRRGLDAAQRNDLTTAANEKDTALAILARLRALPAENVKAWLDKAAELERTMNFRIQSLPTVQGIELTAVDPQGKWVRLRSAAERWQDMRHDLNTTHPRTQIRVLEINPNPAGEPPYVVITKPLHMRTKIAMGAG